MFRLSSFVAARYEVTSILSAKIPVAESQACVRRLATRFLETKGLIYNIVNRGVVNLAYTFRAGGVKHDAGQFLVWEVEANRASLSKLAHDLRQDERVLRHLAIRQDDFRPLHRRAPNRPRNLPKSRF